MAKTLSRRAWLTMLVAAMLSFSVLVAGCDDGVEEDEEDVVEDDLVDDDVDAVPEEDITDANPDDETVIVDDEDTQTI